MLIKIYNESVRGDCLANLYWVEIDKNTIKNGKLYSYDDIVNNKEVVHGQKSFIEEAMKRIL